MDFLCIVTAIIAMVIGLSIGIRIKNNELDRLGTEKNELQKQNNELSEEIMNLKSENSANKTKLEILSQVQELVKKEFTEIANRVIKDEQSDLRAQNRETLEEKLKPIKENFEKFREKIEEFNKQGETNTATIKEKIENLINETLSIKTTATDLTNAIKANSQVRGDFGEIILDNLLKQAGLVNKRDDVERGNYITQQTFNDSTMPNKQTRPDVVLDLPENKNIIIDAKCPLKNFIDYCNSNDDGEKEKSLKCFYGEVSKMINELSGKYNTIEGLHTPEFKLMFIPLESCASYLYSNNDIMSQAMTQNIIIVCPSTLFATLKLVSTIWKRQNESENLENILKIATGAYEKFVIFLEKLEKIKTSFNTTTNAFENAYKTIDGRGGLKDKLKALEELNLKTPKKIPEKHNTNEIIEV